jgi:hypothetical protein
MNRADTYYWTWLCGFQCIQHVIQLQGFQDNGHMRMKCSKKMKIKIKERKNEEKKERENHSTQDSRVVPHRGTNWAALWLTAQIRRDAVLSESYGRGYQKSLLNRLYAVQAFAFLLQKE